MKKLSFGSWAFSFGPYASRPVSFEDTAKRVSEAGYDGIEICGFRPHVTPETHPNAASRRNLVRFLKGLNLCVSGYAADLTAANPTLPGMKHSYLELFTKNAELCSDIGSPSIRVDTIAAPDAIADHEYQAAMDRLATTWNEAAEIASKLGVRMVWEFEPGFAFNKPSEVLELHEEVNHPNFRLLFDTSHAYMCAVVGARQRGKKETLPDGVAEFLDNLKGRIGAIHLIDSDASLHHDETSTHRPFGEGFIDFQYLAPKLLTVPDIDWWTVDLCFWPGSWELVEPSLAFVKQLLSGTKVAA